jgi:hypothetical protein
MVSHLRNMSFRGSVNKKKITSASVARHFRKSTSGESRKLCKNSYFKQTSNSQKCSAPVLPRQDCRPANPRYCFMKEYPSGKHSKAWYNAKKNRTVFSAISPHYSTQRLSHECACPGVRRFCFAMSPHYSPPRSCCPMTAHALASAALNEFIYKSNRGGDLQAAYTVLEGHCVNESTSTEQAGASPAGAGS